MRAFLTLIPDPEMAMAIDRWAEQCWPAIRRRVPVQNLHATLTFLGEIDRNTELALVDKHASSSTIDRAFLYCVFRFPATVRKYS